MVNEFLFYTGVVCNASNAVFPLMLCIEHLTSNGNFQRERVIICSECNKCLNYRIG